MVLIDFLYRVKDKPQVYFGENPSFIKLMDILSTYMLIAEDNIDKDSVHFLNRFNEYVCKYYGLKNVLRYGLTAINMFTESDTAAFYKFFELFECFLESEKFRKGD